MLRLLPQHALRLCHLNLLVYLFTTGAGHARMTKVVWWVASYIVRLDQDQRKCAGIPPVPGTMQSSQGTDNITVEG